MFRYGFKYWFKQVIYTFFLRPITYKSEKTLKLQEKKFKRLNATSKKWMLGWYYIVFFCNDFFEILDNIRILYIYKYISIYFNNNYFRDQYRFNFFNKNYFQSKIFIKNSINLSSYGLKSLWNLIRYWVIPFILFIEIIYGSLIIRVLPFNKICFLWISVIMIFYWLVSGFVFFFKKYQFGKFTSAIQRFWKRSYILFWLLESCLLVTFFYLLFVANQESVYMFDQVQIYKTHLFSWRIFFIKIIPIIILIVISYFLMLTLKWNIFNKHSIWFLISTLLLTYIILLEFFQFYHIVNFYSNMAWIFDVEERLWMIDFEIRKTRTLNHYVMLLLILKFWHLLFVYIFWLFFILRNWEIKRSKYPLFAANYQNLLIVYFMSWLCMYPWFKLFFRKFLDSPYKYFSVNQRSFFLRIFFNDLKINFYGLMNLNKKIFFEKNIFLNNSFFYWIEFAVSFKSWGYKKHTIKTTIINDLNLKFNLLDDSYKHMFFWFNFFIKKINWQEII
jgi:hypothetical protein